MFMSEAVVAVACLCVREAVIVVVACLCVLVAFENMKNVGNSSRTLTTLIANHVSTIEIRINLIK